jgi:hypothetical protein
VLERAKLLPLKTLWLSGAKISEKVILKKGKVKIMFNLQGLQSILPTTSSPCVSGLYSRALVQKHNLT